MARRDNPADEVVRGEWCLDDASSMCSLATLGRSPSFIGARGPWLLYVNVRLRRLPQLDVAPIRRHGPDRSPSTAWRGTACLRLGVTLTTSSTVDLDSLEDGSIGRWRVWTRGTSSTVLTLIRGMMMQVCGRVGQSKLLPRTWAMRRWSRSRQSLSHFTCSD